MNDKKAKQLRRDVAPILAQRQKHIEELQKMQQVVAQASERLVFLRGAIAALNDTVRELGGKLPEDK